jgi:signal peptidase
MSAGPGFTATCAALLRGGERVRFRATGRSMAPAILDGDVLTVVPAGPEEIRPGDVILYPGAWGLLAHRVVARLEDGSFLAQGDAIGSDREEVAPDRILGRVVAVNGKQPLAAPGLRQHASRLVRRVSAITGRKAGRDTLPGDA